jgi:RNA polymerase sigma-70 factor (ECF subfamily)
MTDREQLDRWMTAAADGDRAAIEPLFAALWPIAVRFATRFVGDAVLAEDCAQEGLVRLFGQLSQYDRERDALTWALTHVTWQARTARRQRERRNEVAEQREHDAIDGAALVEERELIRAAVATLELLAPRDLEVIAAAITDDDELRRAIAPATFRKRLERAFARLRTSWRSRHGTL